LVNRKPCIAGPGFARRAYVLPCVWAGALPTLSVTDYGHWQGDDASSMHPAFGII
jgi:hypothetical protein